MVKIERNLASLKESYDLIVIGGGITGISVAREAALRGISVCLIEKGDFSSATSAATSKLIHGGLRYLENYEFSLVRESLRERRLLGAAIPHLCRPLPIILPIYSYSKPNRLIMDLGLRTYDLLAFDKNRGLPEELRMPGARWLSRSEVMRRMPLLQSKDLKGGFLYYDYESISPDRIALAFLKSAVSCGAVTLNHTEVESFQIDQQNDKRRVTGVEIRD